MTSLWDSVPDVHPDGRSIIQYPDPAPESTAAMWDRWREQRAARRASLALVPDEDAGDEVYKNHEAPVITMEAEEFDEPCSALGTWVKAAHQNGWTIVELAHSHCHAKGKMIKSGEREGQKNPDREIETQWLKIEKSGVGRAVISYTIINGKNNGTYRSFNGIAGRSDADMKGILKG